ncbi:MAG: PAS domain S-box protein [Spirochaetes bacterium]|nr:PAS domain S-box protein [Spirochaetota bacterium]MBU1080441.1 PAS domain S-box protein [Spirochaetota bacterium]
MASSQKTVLLVEDELLIAMAEKAMLERHGFKVVTASSGEKAVRAVDEAAEIDLALMDINLGSGMDGTEAAARILEKHDIPLVFLSSHTEREIVEKTESITSYGYIVKNSGETVLLAGIKMAFKLFEADRSIRAHRLRIESAYEELQAISEEQQQTIAELNATNDELELSRLMLAMSEQKYRYLVENSQDLIFTLTTSGLITFVSPSWGTFFGYPMEQAIGKPFEQFIHPDDFPACEAALGKVLRTGERKGTVEYRARKADGEWRWHSSSAAPVRDDSGAIIGFEGISRDITELRNAETLALAERDKAQMYLDVASVIFVALDRRGLVTLANKKACETIGRGRDELLGADWFGEIVPAAYRNGVRGLFDRLIRGESAERKSYEHPVVSAAGEERMIAWTISPARDETGRMIGTLSSGEDITERLRFEERLGERDSLIEARSGRDA